MATQTYRTPAKSCVKIAATKHYFLHFNKKTGKFFYKGENFSAEQIVARFAGRDDNHAILFSAVAAQYIDWVASLNKEVAVAVIDSGDRAESISSGEVVKVDVATV